MAIVVKSRKIGIAPRKVRQVADLIRCKPAKEALMILRFSPKQETSLVLSKLINSGLAIAVDKKEHDLDNLCINAITVDEGRTLKRVRPRAQGRAFRIRKRTSHITVRLQEGEQE